MLATVFATVIRVIGDIVAFNLANGANAKGIVPPIGVLNIPAHVARGCASAARDDTTALVALRVAIGGRLDALRIWCTAGILVAHLACRTFVIAVNPVLVCTAAEVVLHAAHARPADLIVGLGAAGAVVPGATRASWAGA